MKYLWENEFKVGSKITLINIPIGYIRRFGLNPGDKLHAYTDEKGRIIIEPKKGEPGDAHINSGSGNEIGRL
jgi:bifunctional DNA-binding transcriptional regulator/antitoxin component of YhaV-PrlF toxin-antitoxin module